MTKEDKQLLLKDLSARLPYGVIVDNSGRYNFYGYLTTDILKDIQYGTQHYDIKPYLRPMSSMTEEEREEFYSLDFLDFDCYKRTEWLNAHHFDYRGLIEKGLALEAHKGMYKTK